MKRIFTILLIILSETCFGQIPSYPAFAPKNYKFIYFGPATQIVVIDPQLNTTLTPVPYDRFFYLHIYNNDSSPQLVTFAYRERVISKKQLTLAQVDQTLYEYHPLFSRKVTLAAGSTDAKAGYTMYECLVPPLSPTGHYDFMGFYALNNDQLEILKKAMLAIRDDETKVPIKFDDIATILKPINDDKELNKITRQAKLVSEMDLNRINPWDVYIYYEEKIKDKISGNGLTNDEIGDIILNTLHSDISIHARHKPEVSVSDLMAHQDMLWADTVKLDYDDPKFYNIVGFSGAQFKAFAVDVRASSVVTVDAGYVMFGFPWNGFFRGTPYLGIDIYFRAFDPSIPYKYVRENRATDGLNFWNNLSANFGITLNTQAKQYYRADLFGNENIIVGAGYRINNLFKVNFGGLLYYKLDPNFLIDNKHIAVAPYLGASIDIRIGTIYSSFAKLFSL